MKKYIKVGYWLAQKFQDEDWYKEECYEYCYENSVITVVLIPKKLYIKYFKQE